MWLLTNIFLLMTTFSSLAVAQSSNKPAVESKCALSVAQSPTIRGIRLGMSVDHVLALFPGSSNDDEIKQTLQNTDQPPKFGLVTFYLQPYKYPTKDQFSSIDLVHFTVFDGRVVSFTIMYAGGYRGAEWSHVDDLINKIAEVLRLPDSKSWVPESQRFEKSLSCGGFDVRASVLNRNGTISILIAGEDYQRQKSEREAAHKEKMRREFKP